MFLPKILAIILSIFLSGEVHNAYAQVDVDRDFQPKVAEQMESAPKRPLKIEEKKKEEIEKAGPTIYISKVILVGTQSFKPEEFAHITKEYEAKNLTKGDLDELAKKIQEEYLKKGVIAACFIPPQEVKDGVITYRIVEAKMGELKIQEHNLYDPGRLKNYWRTASGEVLRYDRMSEDLQIINSNPDRKVRAALKAGGKPETTDVLLDVKNYFPVHLILSFDNEGSLDTGKERKGIGIRHNNLLMADDIAIAGYIYGSYFSNLYMYEKIPITNFGTSVMAGYTYSKSAPKKDQETQGLSSTSRTTSLYLYQDLYHDGKYIGEFSFGGEQKDKTTHIINGTQSRDLYGILRAGSKLTAKAWGGVTSINPKISQGVNTFAARRKDPVFSSRSPGVDDGVENTFTKFNLDVSHRRPLLFGSQLGFNFSGQIASEKLASQEEFYVGGLDSVRGYPSGDFSADTVFQTNFEILFPVSFLPDWLKFPYGERPIKEEITGVIFWDYAHAERRGVLDSEVFALNAESQRRIGDYSSIGAGVRIRLANQALLRLEWGYPIGGDRAVSEEGESRFHISMSFEDKFHEEYERLKLAIQEENMKKTTLSLIDNEMQRPGSELGEFFNDYLEKARAFEEEGRTLEAREYYAKIYQTASSLYMQSRQYIEKTKSHKKTLEAYSASAKTLYDKGDIDGARKLWQKVIDESKIEPLELVLNK